MVVRDVCPRCQSPTYKSNGHMHHGKQNQHGHDCGRQFGDCSEPYLLSEDTRALIECMLVERISWRGSCRAVGVTRKGLVGLLVHCVEALPDHLNVKPLSRTQAGGMQRLEVDADAMPSLVKKQEHKPWMWIAMAAKTRQVIALHVGERSRRRAKQGWAKMPAASRQHATLYTDQDVV